MYRFGRHLVDTLFRFRSMRREGASGNGAAGLVAALPVRLLALHAAVARLLASGTCLQGPPALGRLLAAVPARLLSTAGGRGGKSRGT
jgi:hypothetical protein